MNSRRTARVASVVREVVSNAILFELRDPRIANVTVTRTEVSGDLQHAKVYVSIMADEKAQTLCMHGLNSSRGYLQSKLAERVTLVQQQLAQDQFGVGFLVAVNRDRFNDGCVRGVAVDRPKHERQKKYREQSAYHSPDIVAGLAGSGQSKQS